MKACHFIFLISTFFLGGFTSFAQKSKSEGTKVFSKITIEEGEIYLTDSDSLLVDSLVIKNKGKLIFLNENTVVAISHAFIGNQCKFDASGLGGDDGNEKNKDGKKGRGGRSLTISIRLEQLGSLNVITRGGDGGGGFQGATGEDANSRQGTQNGENGGYGGDGGTAGDLNFFYLSPHFIVVLNEDRKHSVRFDFNGGKGGPGGKGGQPGRRMDTKGPSATQSRNGNDGMDGLTGAPGKFRVLKTDS